MTQDYTKQGYSVSTPATNDPPPEIRHDPAVADAAGGDRTALDPTGSDIGDEWELESFPASDPPANW